MVNAFVKNGLPAITLLASLASLVWLLFSPPDLALQVRNPGQDNPPDSATRSGPGPLEQVTTTSGDGIPSGIDASWPAFRGHDQTNVASDTVPLAREWHSGGPPLLWRIPLGEGYAGAAVHKGRVFLLDYDQDERRDILRCLSLDNGAEIWRTGYPVDIKRFHGMSRTIPAVTDRFVVTLGPKCQVMCVDMESGAFRWGLDLVREFGTTVPEWYAGQCPVIRDDIVYLAPAGDILMMAVDCESGEVLWRAPNSIEGQMTHASITFFEFGGAPMLVYPTTRGVVGVHADDGTMLWAHKDWSYRIIVPSAVPLGMGRLFFTNGYNRGSQIVRVRQTAEGFSAEAETILPAREFGAEQHTPVLWNNHLYGIRGGQSTGELICLTPSGEIVWSSGSTNRFGLGPFLIAQGLIYVMDNDGILTLVDASPLGYRPLAQAKVLDGHESWAPMALAAGRLLVRDLTELRCLNVGGGSNAGQ